MVIKKTVCDKCKCELEGRPDKITFSEATEKQKGYGNVTYKTYQVTRTIHLCKGCMRKLEKFLEEKEV